MTAGRLPMGSSMSWAKINSEGFTANLYLDGFPLVLNQQRLQQALRHKRITPGEKLDAEVGLADLRKCSFITLADYEDDTPLLLKFVPEGNCYAIQVILQGVFDGARLFIEDQTHNLLVSTSAPTQLFSISTYGAVSNIVPGPAYIGLNREPKYKPLYRKASAGMSEFLDADPNLTRHNAFNQESAKFVIKVLK